MFNGISPTFSDDSCPAPEYEPLTDYEDFTNYVISTDKHTRASISSEVSSSTTASQLNSLASPSISISIVGNGSPNIPKIIFKKSDRAPTATSSRNTSLDDPNTAPKIYEIVNKSCISEKHDNTEMSMLNESFTPPPDETENQLGELNESELEEAAKKEDISILEKEKKKEMAKRRELMRLQESFKDSKDLSTSLVERSSSASSGKPRRKAKVTSLKSGEDNESHNASITLRKRSQSQSYCRRSTLTPTLNTPRHSSDHQSDEKIEEPRSQDDSVIKLRGSVDGGVTVSTPTPAAETDEKVDVWTPPPKVGWDSYCWKCVRSSNLIPCTICQRCYHVECLKGHMKPEEIPANWACPECASLENFNKFQTKAGKIPFLPEELNNLLTLAMKRIKLNESFKSFIDETYLEKIDKKYLVNPITIKKIFEKLERNSYRTTEEFATDIRWFHHNVLIVAHHKGNNSKQLTAVKALVKATKVEAVEIEFCSECYFAANTREDWFIDVCSKPHLILWAKLKGFPHWPAKAMGSSPSHMVNVRFFGAHDRAQISPKDCFLYSKEFPFPTVKKSNRFNLQNCMDEVEKHIEKLKAKYGAFEYAPLRKTYDPSKELEQLHMMLPKYKEIMERNNNKTAGLQFKIFKTPDNNLSMKQIDPSTTDFKVEESNTCTTSIKSPVIRIASAYEVISKIDGKESDALPKVILKRKPASPDNSAVEFKKCKNDYNSEMMEVSTSTVTFQISTIIDPKKEIPPLAPLSSPAISITSIASPAPSTLPMFIPLPTDCVSINSRLATSTNTTTSTTTKTTPVIESIIKSKQGVTFTKITRDEPENKVLSAKKTVITEAITSVITSAVSNKKPLQPFVEIKSEPIDENEEKMPQTPKPDPVSLNPAVYIKDEVLSEGDDEVMPQQPQLQQPPLIQLHPVVKYIPKGHRKPPQIKKAKTQSKVRADIKVPIPCTNITPPVDIKKISVRNTILNARCFYAFPTQKAPDTEPPIIPTLTSPAPNKIATATVAASISRNNFTKANMVCIPIQAVSCGSVGTETTTTNTTTEDKSRISTVISTVPMAGTSNHILDQKLSSKLASAITESMVPSPPRLIPNPTGPIKSNGEYVLPSSTGPYSQRLEENAHKMVDFFRSILLETYKDLATDNDKDAIIVTLKLELEKQQKSFESQADQMKRNADTVLTELRKTYEKEKVKLTADIRRECELERRRIIDETKRKQWCASCWKEAQFYCCWNTSYCSYECQTRHWFEHRNNCNNQDRPNSDSSSNGSTTITALPIGNRTTPAGTVVAVEEAKPSNLPRVKVTLMNSVKEKVLPLHQAKQHVHILPKPNMQAQSPNLGQSQFGKVLPNAYIRPNIQHNQMRPTFVSSVPVTSMNTPTLTVVPRTEGRVDILNMNMKRLQNQQRQF